MIRLSDWLKDLNELLAYQKYSCYIFNSMKFLGSELPDNLNLVIDIRWRRQMCAQFLSLFASGRGQSVGNPDEKGCEAVWEAGKEGAGSGIPKGRESRERGNVYTKLQNILQSKKGNELETTKMGQEPVFKNKIGGTKS